MSALRTLSAALLVSTASAKSTTKTDSAPSLVEFGNCASFALHSETAMSFAITGSIVTGDAGFSSSLYLAVGGFTQPWGQLYDYTSSLSVACQEDKLAAGVTLAALTGNNIAADLAGVTLTAGIYCTPSGAFEISTAGVLTLDGGGNLGSEFIFQTTSTLTTGAAASVALINSAQGGNCYWSVGSSVTLGLGSAMYGNIIAVESITMSSGTSVYGRGFANCITCDGVCTVKVLSQVATPSASAGAISTSIEKTISGCEIEDHPISLTCPPDTAMTGGYIQYGRFPIDDADYDCDNCPGQNTGLATPYWEFYSLTGVIGGQGICIPNQGPNQLTNYIGSDPYQGVHKQYSITYYCDDIDDTALSANSRPMSFATFLRGPSNQGGSSFQVNLGPVINQGPATCQSNTLVAVAPVGSKAQLDSDSDCDGEDSQPDCDGDAEDGVAAPAPIAAAVATAQPNCATPVVATCGC